MTTPADSISNTILAEVRQTGRQVNRLRHMRLSMVSLLCLLFAGLGAFGSYAWSVRHTYPAGVSIATRSFVNDDGTPLVELTVIGSGNYKVNRSFAQNENRQTVALYFIGGR